MSDYSADDLPKGLLSFLYNTQFDQKIYKLAIDDINQAIVKFDLTSEQARLVRALKDAGQPDEELVDRLLLSLKADFNQFYEKVW